MGFFFLTLETSFFDIYFILFYIFYKNITTLVSPFFFGVKFWHLGNQSKKDVK
jgi:hypothetical protein